MSTQVILPHRGEFGQMLMTYVRWVHELLADKKVVCCRRGDEPLFPSADAYEYEWQGVPDVQRNTKFLMGAENKAYLEELEKTLEAKYPGAEFRYPLDGVKPQRFPWLTECELIPTPIGKRPHEKPEILVAPRFRAHGAHRNYQHWHTVIDGLERAGFQVGLLGVAETSVDRPGLQKGFRAWDHEDNLSTTLHWMKTAKLVLCTDSGIAHLAVLARAPLAVIYEVTGVEVGKEEWKWAYDHMKAHSVARCDAILGGWSNPERVVGHVLTVATPRAASCRKCSGTYSSQRSNTAAT